MDYIMRKRLLVFFILLGFITNLFSTDIIAKIDSLQNVLSEASEKEKVDILIELIVLNLDIQPAISIIYGNQLLALAEKFDLKASEVDAYNLLGVANEYLGDYKTAISYFQDALKIAKESQDKDAIARALVNIGIANLSLSNFYVSLEYNLKALDLYEELNDEVGISNALNNIGNVYLSLSNYEKALEYYFKSLEYKGGEENKESYAKTMHNIALSYQQLKDYDKALDYYRRALEIMEQHQNLNLAICYNNLSAIFKEKGNSKTALDYNTKAFQIHENIGNKEGIATTCNLFAELYISTNRFGKAYEQVKRSLKISGELDLKDLIAENYKTMANYYAAIGEFEQALEFHKKYSSLHNSIYTEENIKKLAELQAKYEIEKKEKEIELLTKDKLYHYRFKNVLIIIIVFGVLAIIFLLFLYIEKIKEVTIRKETEDKYIASEEKYKSLTESLKTAVYTFNLEGRFTYVNPAMLEITGYNEEELYNMSFFDFVHPHFKDMVMKTGFSRLKGEDVISNYEFKIINKNGEERWAEVSNVRTVINGMISILGTASDITDRKITEEKIIKSESQFRALFSSMDDLIIVLDRKGKYLEIAPTNPNLLYKPEEELIGKILHEVFPEEKATYFLNKIEESLNSQVPISIEYTLDIEDKKYWFEGRISPMIEDKVLLVVRDITVSKLSLKKLVESEKKYRNLVESIAEGLVIVDENENFLFSNKAALDIYGYSEDEILTMNVRDLVSEKTFKKVQKETAKRMNGKSSKYEIAIIRKNGDQRLTSISASPLFKYDKFIGSFELFIDITDIRKAEEELRASLREKEVMLQEIYHRVKNNMQIISSMLKLQSAHVTDETSLNLFKNCQNRVRSMSLVHEKLYRSKDLSRTNFEDYINSLMRNLFISYGISDKRIRYHVEAKDIFLNISTAIPCGLIINELISNSIKFAFPDDKKGHIIIKLNKDKKDKFTLIIRNDGIDFPEEIDLENASSFGMQLVNILTQQLHAESEIVRKGGTTFKFIFNELK
jgi:PAS domain S-box-containing protein